MSHHSRLLAALFAFLSAAAAQDDTQGGMPGPAPELQKLAPLIGNWAGSGTANFGPGAPPAAWQARGTYRWCLDQHFVGEVATMDAWFTADGKMLSTCAGLTMGQPTVQRLVMEFDANGAATGAVGHTISGTEAPFESFRATYTKK